MLRVNHHMGLGLLTKTHPAIDLPQLFALWAGLPVGGPTLEARDGWEFHPYMRDGQAQAIAAVHGAEIHFAVSPDWRHKVIARQRTQEFLAPLLGRLGFLTTRAVPSEKNHHFLSRLGFVKTQHDGRFDHYMLTDLPFSKG